MIGAAVLDVVPLQRADAVLGADRTQTRDLS